MIFDTDHIPTRTFLSETVPWFADEEVGVVQTPHVFRNPDIFQRAFHLEGRIPNEADLFNRGIQPARDSWGGAFFVGSGAVFRRSALEEIGGFQVFSITEDIHTCTHLHAAGWRSIYVDKALASGLAAENLSSYIVQRRRWMLGCLQVFFRDNPLFRRGLSLRHRLAYFGSLYHFFFPLARIVFWVTPLYYLFFHLHPIFSEVAVLTARLLPYLIVLPLISSVLMPRWPRPFWGAFYETVVSAPLARSMFDLFLPSTLGFKATPKGIVYKGRRFDWRSAHWTLVLAALTLAGIAKGAWELTTFGIERDAYFFNLIWASYNLLFLIGALLVAWERPQRRVDDRVPCQLAARIENGASLHAVTRDVSLSGCSLILDERTALPYSFDLVLGMNGGGMRLRAELVFHERYERRELVGVRFVDPTPETARGATARRVRAQRDLGGDARGREPHPLRAGRGVLPRLRALFPPRASLEPALSHAPGAGVPARSRPQPPAPRLAARLLAGRRGTALHRPPAAPGRAVADLRAALGSCHLDASALRAALARRDRGDRGAEGPRDAGVGTCGLGDHDAGGNCRAWYGVSKSSFHC